MRNTGLVYRFGRFRFDASEQVLFCDGEPVHLTPKAFTVLRLLVENAGHIVEKDELMRQCWADSFVEEANLAQTICTLRHTLGESRDRGESIKPVHRRGYRFVAKVSAPDVDSSVYAKKPDARPTSDQKIPPADDFTERGRAHHLYMRGRYYWRRYTKEGLSAGIRYFRQAIKVDPDYAPAYVGFGDCYYRLANIQLRPGKAMAKAKAAALKSLSVNARQIDDTLAEAHALLGLIKIFYDRDWLAAESEFKRAAELAPASALVHKRYGWALGMLARFDEAIRETERALDLEPRSADLRTGLGIILHLARRYDAAIAQAQMALDAEPEFFPARVLLGISHLQQGRVAVAVKELEKAASLADIPWTLGYLGYAYGVSGRRRQALKVLGQLKQQSEKDYSSPYAFALVHNGLGHKEQALQFLVKTFEDRNEMPGFVKTSPEFDNLRSDQRFEALLNLDPSSQSSAWIEKPPSVAPTHFAWGTSAR